MTRSRVQSGFAYIAAVILLVVVAGIAVALLRLTTTQQSTVNQALLAARAGLAARGGIEWVYQDLVNRCAATGRKTDLADFVNDAGFKVTVNCSFQVFHEGQHLVNDVPTATAKRIYRIESIACNGSSVDCPDKDSIARPDYVERARVATVCTRQPAGGVTEYCY
ncbi:MSHA biogenesis protein MshP [Massilia oculi]|uniref:hypothetical protein n=1 Tax=Massilia oculi TaxID=945844 RepID=UPI0013B42105|nr:hypothetical protein [Massilia oculi]